MTDRVPNMLVTGLFCLAFFTSCSNSRDQEEKTVRPVAPVTVVSPRTGRMVDYAELMATSAFLEKAVIKSPVTGYVEKCSVSPGDIVVKNQLLLRLRTRESVALGQDSLGPMNLRGNVTINASMNGVVNTIDHQPGDFVQEGDALAMLVIPGSLVFLLEIPFEMKSLVHIGHECNLVLPDNTVVSAFVRSVLPSMSEASQTQRVVLQPRSARDIPGGRMARVRIVRTSKNNAVILPKSCILNDEIMKNVWVMKLLNDSTAVKIPVKTGISGTDSIEVVSPVFGAADRILTGGNYGLGDTAAVRIIKHD